VRNAVDAVRTDAGKFARESRDARKELADILRAPDYDRERVRSWFVAREADFQRVRESVVSALGDVYEVLDDQQREKLARLVEKASHGHRGCDRGGPYRNPGAEA
jgi:Spy/CpxP family protein refolding chaperone